MTRVLIAALLLLPAVNEARSADTIGEFDIRAIKFTGGEYKDEQFKYLVLPPKKIEKGKRYPLVYFMHGAGERGSDPKKLLVHFPVQMAKPEWREKYPCFVVVPQCRNDKLWMNQHWSKKESIPLDEEPNEQMQVAIQILERSIKEMPVDADRVYLTGLSMGGFGAWELAMRRPKLIAALAPVCGGADESKAGVLKDIPIWTAHGDADRAVWPIRSRRMVEKVKQAGGTIKYTEYPGVGHNSWTPFYADPKGVVPWMFEQRRAK